MNVFEDENNKFKLSYTKPTSGYSVFQFLQYKNYFVNVEVVPKKFLEDHNISKNKYYLSGFEVAVLKNDLEMVKKILDWAEKYQYVEGEIDSLQYVCMVFLRNIMLQFKPTICFDWNYLDNNLEKAGGLVTYLIQGQNERNPMIDSIYFGYVDMMDLLIE